jgi:hypothetical protein
LRLSPLRDEVSTYFLPGTLLRRSVGVVALITVVLLAGTALGTSQYMGSLAAHGHGAVEVAISAATRVIITPAPPAAVIATPLPSIISGEHCCDNRPHGSSDLALATAALTAPDVAPPSEPGEAAKTSGASVVRTATIEPVFVKRSVASRPHQAPKPSTDWMRATTDGR